MTSKSKYAVSVLLCAVLLLAAYATATPAQPRATHQPRAAKKGGTPQPSLATAVSGSGTSGQIAKWTSGATLGNSGISEDKNGQIGIGTATPTSRLTVNGAIETTAGGVKFPDGTVQTTAFSAPASSTPPLQPLAKDLNAQFPLNGSSTTAAFTVPAGKRLVIETAVLLVNLPLGQIVESFTISTSVNGQVVFYSLFPTLTSQSDVTSFYGINQPLKIYADGGTQVSANILRSGSGTGGFDLAVSGCLVDM